MHYSCVCVCVGARVFVCFGGHVALVSLLQLLWPQFTQRKIDFSKTRIAAYNGLGPYQTWGLFNKFNSALLVKVIGLHLRHKAPNVTVVMGITLISAKA